MLGVFSLNIFWIDKENGVGYGVADDWKNNTVQWYKFGSDESWLKFRNRVADAQF